MCSGVVRKPKTTAKARDEGRGSETRRDGTADLLAAFEQALVDVTNAGNIKEIVSAEGDWAVSVELAPERERRLLI